MKERLNKALKWWLVDYLRRYFVGIGACFTGLFIVMDVEWAIRFPSMATLTWHDTFSRMPIAWGWGFLFLGLDLFLFRSWVTATIVKYVVWVPVKLLLCHIFGKEKVESRLAKMSNAISKERQPA
jgi:hypothetical protein